MVPAAVPSPAAARRSDAVDAVVVGSGPNGLAAAVTLARAGLEVELIEGQDTLGGGSRTLELGLAAGISHDVCSAVHPMALASPFLRAFDLPARGVELLAPEASYAQPLDDEPAAIAWRDLERTAQGLGADARTWHALFSPLVAQEDAIVDLSLGDKRSLPRELLAPGPMAAAARFAAALAVHGTPAWSLPWRTERARALLTGVGAHAIGPLPSLATSGVALMLATLAHGGGWPIPRGGSQAIADALIADLRAHGGRIRTGTTVTSREQLPPARAILLDTTAQAAAQILGTAVPSSLRRALARFPRGDAAAKVDFVLSGPVPWRDPEVALAGTQHLGGTRAQMAQAEAEVARGRMPQRPMVLASDPATVDPGRQREGLRPLWAYAHVPYGSTQDPTEAVTAQIERFAPGFRDVVVAARGIPAAQMSRHDANLVGGDISLGRISLPRLVARPTASPDPYRLGDSGAYLCSSAVPPAPGVHGMNGWHAARRVLRQRFGIRRAPRLGPGA
ncbi:phytoene desaturase family protein [Brachybacterium phenoliresistens]|uniref:Pyridine nucleotide-disulfide oxidoreductase domain-containing protein 2 n=1 Tax=Brachybacterium phenoliresistens TaxID=396014 RepID=Z9JXQ5_9MICO|nr:NAD(P)/FAD-dependent oxidoreductase [Brachybacterium phenoliresistens]EWS82581.1 phytoene dehydrogenase [Brachybacterium phenoliresistens]